MKFKFLQQSGLVSKFNCIIHEFILTKNSLMNFSSQHSLVHICVTDINPVYYQFIAIFYVPASRISLTLLPKVTNIRQPVGCFQYVNILSKLFNIVFFHTMKTLILKQKVSKANRNVFKSNLVSS